MSFLKYRIILRLLQKSLFVIPEVFIGNPVFFKTKDFWIPALRVVDLRGYDSRSDFLKTFARNFYYIVIVGRITGQSVVGTAIWSTKYGIAFLFFWILCYIPKIEIRKGVSDPESSSGRQDYLDSVLAF